MISASYLGEFFRLAILNCQSDSISLILDLPTKFFKHLLKKLSTPPFKNFKLRCTLHQWNANVCSTVWWVLASCTKGDTQTPVTIRNTLSPKRFLHGCSWLSRHPQPPPPQGPHCSDFYHVSETSDKWDPAGSVLCGWLLLPNRMLLGLSCEVLYHQAAASHCQVPLRWVNQPSVVQALLC